MSKKIIEEINKELLKSIILEDGIENISFNDNTFTIKLGDILNTEPATGFQYLLLDTYIEVPYNFEPTRLKLHRGIVNEHECYSTDAEDEDEYYEYAYSGFVHYSGYNFCYGESGVDYICNTIRDEGLDSDKFNMFLIKLKTFLSVSSHGTMDLAGDYMKLDLPEEEIDENYKLIEVATIDGKKYPFKILKTQHNLTVSKICYDESYIEVLKEYRDKAFTYNNETIIPKIVKHKLVEEKRTVETIIRVDLVDILNRIQAETIKNIENEISNKKRITFQDLIHKFPDKFSRVDGCLYL